MLNRRVKSDVRDIDSGSYGYAKGLNGPIEILVIQRVFIVPDSRSGVGDLVTHKPDAIVTRIGLELIYCCTCPSHDRGLLSMGDACSAKTEGRGTATHSVLMIRRVVVHVTLVRMSLAPGVFVRHDILRLGKIGCAHVLRWNQVIRVHQNSVRRHVMNVAGVIVCSRTYKTSGERIDPCARTNAGLAAVQTGPVCIGAAGAKVAPAYAIAPKAACV